MTTLADINQQDWTLVGRKITGRGRYDFWDYSLPPNEVGLLNLARDSGRIITIQRKDEGDGVTRMWAILPPPKRQAIQPPDTFAAVGRGMFEQ